MDYNLLREYIVLGDTGSAEITICDLYYKDRKKFFCYSFLNNVIPEPVSHNYKEEKYKIENFNAACNSLCSKFQSVEIAELKHRWEKLYNSIQIIDSKLSGIKKELNKCNFIKFPLYNQIQVLCIFLEVLSVRGYVNLLRRSELDNSMNGFEYEVANVYHKGKEIMLSQGDLEESALKAVEIILGYLYHLDANNKNNKRDFSYSNIDVYSIFEELGLNRIMELAHKWNFLLGYWGHIKYLGWEYEELNSGTTVEFHFKPENSFSYIIKSIAIKRYLSEAFNMYNYAMNYDYSKSHESALLIEELASKVTGINDILQLSKEEYKQISYIQEVKTLFASVKIRDTICKM